MAVAQGKLSHLKIEWDERPTACVVMASEGYPGNYPKGKVVSGLVEAGKKSNVSIFHAGTALRDGKVVTSGGRVLCVAGVGNDIKEALDNAYGGVREIHFEGAHYRKDIGWRAIR